MRKPGGLSDPVVPSYMYAGQGPARWLATLSRAVEPLSALARAGRPLLALAVPPPLAEAWSLTTILRPLMMASSTMGEAGDGERSSHRREAAPVEPAVATHGVTDPLSQFTTPVKGYGTRARQPRARPLPGTGVQLTQAELQELAGEPWMAALLGDTGQPRRPGPGLLPGQAGPRASRADVPPAKTASATLIEVLGQRLPGRTRPGPQVSGSRPADYVQPVLEETGAQPTVQIQPTLAGSEARLRGQNRPTVEKPDLGAWRRLRSLRPSRTDPTSISAVTAHINQTLSALMRNGFAQPIGDAVATRTLLLRLTREDTAFGAESAAKQEGSTSSVVTSPSPGESLEPMGAALDAPGGTSQEQQTGEPVTLGRSEMWPGPALGPTTAATALQTLINAWFRSHRPDSPSSRAEAAPQASHEVGGAVAALPKTTALPETWAPPTVQNTFNVTVHTVGGVEDETELADRIAGILVDQARRHGIDLA
jgi:hypothetical protein